MSGIFWNPEVSARDRSAELSSQAVVLDVIVNEEHDDYGRTGFNVGTIRFKYLDRGSQRDSAKTGFRAYPLEVTVQEYPLIGEIVLVQKIQGNHFYSRRVNVNKKLQLNSFSSVLDRLKPIITGYSHQEVQQGKGGQLHQSSHEPEENLTNENYLPQEFLYNLKHFDGDVIVQNRYGATLRFGSSQMEDALNQKTDPTDPEVGDKVTLGPTNPLVNDPIIVMRVGKYTATTLPNRTRNTDYGLVVEDINTDNSSFVLSTNQVINLNLSGGRDKSTGSDPTPGAGDSYFTTTRKLDKSWIRRDDTNKQTPFSSNQSLLNSGRIVLNSKMFLESSGQPHDGIILSSGRDIISLSNRDTILTTGQDFAIAGRKIFLVSENHNPIAVNDAGFPQSVAIADEVIKVLKKLIKALIAKGAYSVAGPSVIPTGILGPLAQIYGEDLEDIKSKLVKIEK